MAGGGGGPAKSDEPQPHPPKDQLPNISYCITSPPPWPEAILLGFQHFLVMLGTTVLIPTALVPQMGGGNAEKAKVIETLLFVAGINTLVQTLFGSRLPAVIGGSYTYVPTTISIILAGRFSNEPDPIEKFKKIMRAVQGALIVASTLQIVLGFSGLWRNVARFLSPLSAVPLVSLVGFGLYELGFPGVAKCVEIGLPELILLVFVSQYVPHVLHSGKNIFDRFSVLFTIAIVWIYAVLLTGDRIGLFNQILTGCCGEQPSMKFPELLRKNFKKEGSSLPPHFTSKPTESDTSSARQNPKCYRACSGKCTCNHKHLIDIQKKELRDLKALKLKIKNEVEEMQSQFQRFFNDIGCQVNEMSTKALGYQKVVEENRKLYNMVQDLKGNIRVYCRIRPTFRAESKTVTDFIGEDGSLCILDPSKTLKDGRKLFQFNRIFGPTAGQDEVYRDTQPLIRSVMDGYNVCIFAYGQTGSGKTHTMSGPSGGTSKDMGINYLALNDLFQMSSERKDNIKYEIYVQMVEIYNEQVRDLLAEDKTENKLEIRSCNDDGLSLPDARLRSVNSTTDVMTLMKLGEVNRAVSSTAINNRSSRSHSVLTVHVSGKDTSGNCIRSCLHLVDLAGSERVDKSEVTGDRLKEALYINKSLSCLGDVITALAQKNSHIPYRNSKLTLLLQDSLGGHAKTLMFAHVSPESDSFGETVSTLKFAQRVSTVELGAARMNKETSEVMQLKAQVENLKIALANKENSKPFSRTKEFDTPLEKTPLRPRRLSIENYSVIKTNKPVKADDKSGAKSPSYIARSRRLSLEGPRTVKKAPACVNKTLQFEPIFQQKDCPLQDPEAVSKLNGQLSNGNSRSELHVKAPPSPTNMYQKRCIKVDTEIQIHPLDLPQTSEELDKNDSNRIVPSDIADSITAKGIGSTNGKGSQFRRSLRTIGKLINGPDKKNQQIMVEVKSPVKGSSAHGSQIKSPIAASERPKRRQSLTGIPSGPNNSRRSSLGGKPVPAAYEPERNARTPPPVRSESKTSKRWL